MTDVLSQVLRTSKKCCSMLLLHISRTNN